MSILIPGVRPELLRNIETDFGTTIAEAIWRKILDNINWMNAQLPVGLVMFFYSDIRYAQTTLDNPGFIAAPGPSWKAMDGSVVNDPLSPLNGVTIPNLLNYFPKHAQDGQIGIIGGHPTVTIYHDHGSTGYTDTNEHNRTTDNNPEQRGPNVHNHGIFAEQWTIANIPLYFTLQPYIRIRNQSLSPGATTLSTDDATLKIDDDLSRFGSIMSKELAIAIRLALANLTKSFPVGEIAPIMTNLPGVSVDPNMWQECNLSEITNPFSQLRSLPGSPRFTPDLRDSFIRIPANPGLIGTIGGSHQLTGLYHNHSGLTGYYGTPEDADPSDGADNVSFSHAHSIPADLAAAYDMQPPYFTLKYFIKIQ